MLTLGSSAIVSAIAIGVVVLQFQDNKTLILSDVLYVPLMRRNLISVSDLSIKVILLLLELKWLLKEVVLLYVLVLNQMVYT